MRDEPCRNKELHDAHEWVKLYEPDDIALTRGTGIRGGVYRWCLGRAAVFGWVPPAAA